MSDAVLSVEDIDISYGTVHAVDRVRFSIERGEIFGLLGPNGAGKTSILSAIEGLLVPDKGVIRIAGHDIMKNPAFAKANMGVQLQSTSFPALLTVQEIVALFAGLYGVATPPGFVTNLLKGIRLEDASRKRFGQLSGGQQQRVLLLIATIHNPGLVLLDEPTTGLDPHSRRQFWDRIETIRNSGRSVLLTTHSMEEAEAVCDRIAIIDHGTIIATDTPENLIATHADDPRVRAASRGPRITLEDVFIGFTGSEVRN